MSGTTIWNYIKKFGKEPLLLPYSIARHLPYSWMSDKHFLELGYFCWHHKKMDWENPKTLNEKLQWLKVYGDNEKYAIYTDKQKVKAIVADLIGEDKVIPTLAVYNTVDEINLDELPEQFVLKCTHDSSSICICRDRNTFDFEAAKKKLAKRLKRNWYYTNRETVYKYLNPVIIAEKYMEDEEAGQLRDYKFYCFNGHVEFVLVDFDRFTGHKRTLYDLEWNALPYSIHYESSRDRVLPKPENYEEMIECAKILSKGFPHVRIDLYSINGKTYFGECTFYHGGGRIRIKPKEVDRHLGDLTDLSLVKNDEK